MSIMYSKMSELYLDKEEEIYSPLKAIQYTNKDLKQNVFCNSKAIGDLFYYGNGVKKDLKKAEFYYDCIAREKLCDDCSARCNEYCKRQLYSIWSSKVLMGVYFLLRLFSTNYRNNSR